MSTRPAARSSSRSATRRCSGSAKAGRSSIAAASSDAMRNGQGGYQLRTHGGRVPVQWLIGTDGWGLFIHQPFGAFDLTGPNGRADARRRRCRSTASSSCRRIPRRSCASTRASPACPRCRRSGRSATSSRIARSPAPTRSCGCAKTMREKKLPCDALIYLGTDFTPSGWNTHNGEFTWNAGELPRSEEGDRRAARAALQGRPARRHRRTAPDRHGQGPCTAPERAAATPERGDVAEGHVAARAQRRLLLAASQGRLRSRHRRLVAGSGRRPRRAVAARTASACTGKARSCGGPNERPYRAASQRLRRDAALRRVPLVGRRLLDVGDAARPTCRSRSTPGSQRHSVLGHRHRRLRADAGVHRRAVRALVPVRRVLSAVPLARPHLAPAAAVGLEHGRARARTRRRAIGDAGRSARSRSCTTRRSSRSAASTSSCATG